MIQVRSVVEHQFFLLNYHQIPLHLSHLRPIPSHLAFNLTREPLPALLYLQRDQLSSFSLHKVMPGVGHVNRDRSQLGVLDQTELLADLPAAVAQEEELVCLGEEDLGVLSAQIRDQGVGFHLGHSAEKSGQNEQLLLALENEVLLTLGHVGQDLLSSEPWL